MRRGMRLALITGLAVLATAPPAAADHHEALIGEVYPGSAANPDDEFVEVRMYLPDQNFFSGANLEFYNSSGTKTGTLNLLDVSNDANQRTLLAGTPSMETTFAVQADVDYGSAALASSGGGVCLTSDEGFGTIDCVAWGGVALSGAGNPAAPISDGSSLGRDPARGCNTLLERIDDTGVSSSDFVEAAPSPEPNSVEPSAFNSCPNGVIEKKPKKKSTDRTPKFVFSGGDAYECKLDSAAFVECSNPFKPGRLSRGKHSLKVRATETDGSRDGTPAKYSWKIVRG